MGFPMPSRVPFVLYRCLALAASLSGIGIAIGMSVDGLDNMFFFLIWAVAAVFVAISIAYGATSLSAAAGKGTAFWVSWLLGGLLLIPLGAAVFFLIVAREPEGLWEDWPRISDGERGALIALVATFISLGAATVLGFVVRKQRGPGH
jgi:hypothetical protein